MGKFRQTVLEESKNEEPIRKEGRKEYKRKKERKKERKRERERSTSHTVTTLG